MGPDLNWWCNYDFFLNFVQQLLIKPFMEVSITYWQEKDGMYLGYLNEYPDHWTQGMDLQDLKDHLKDLYYLFNTDDVLPGIKKTETIAI